ncbi:MAG: chromate transporter [Oscillospiraceae bacterium]|nr:chromate transporter [Oscillospiraceae bacterium]
MIYIKLFLTFFKIGAFTFGGGYAMIPLIQQEVLAHGWLTAGDIVNFIAISESTPGPFAINMATFVGSQTGGFFGAVCSTIGVVMPSFIIILLVAKFYLKFKSSKTVSACMSGLRPAVIGMIGAAALSIAAEVFIPTKITLEYFTSYSFITTLIIFIICLVMVFKKLSPIIVVFTAAALGIAAGYLKEIVG